MVKSVRIRREPGRPTLSDGELMGRRDRLVWLLSVSWGDIGWELPKANTPNKLYKALAPLRGHPGEDIVAIFIRPSKASATAEEIRKLGKELGKSVDRMYAAQEAQRVCADSFRQADSAIKMNQVEDVDTELKLNPRLEPQHREAIVSQFRIREAKLRWADNAMAESTSRERNIRAELEEKQAAFAQAELLDYLIRAQYARNPLSLANAMAGLPNLGWSQSYARCSKINCAGWPSLWFSVFEAIRDIWNLRTSVSEPSIVELFRTEIQKLPKKTLVYYEPEKRKIWMPNQVRSRLAENFRFLRLAVEETLQAKMHPGRVPFVITSKFEKNIDKPRQDDDALLIANEHVE